MQGETRNKIMELINRKNRADRVTATLFLWVLLLIVLYGVYQYQTSRDHGHSYGTVLSKLLASDKSDSYLCRIRMEDGKEVDATCYPGSITGSKVSIIKVKPQGGMVIYQVEQTP
jgi:hypothetical protein